LPVARIPLKTRFLDAIRWASSVGRWLPANTHEGVPPRTAS
jgi:hypothetical protein